MGRGSTVASTNIEQAISGVRGFSGEQQFYATRYLQGGRTVYSLDLSLAQVGLLIRKPDPERPTEGNRAIRAKHADGFGKYIRSRPDWVAPSIILRAQNIFKFEHIADLDGAEFGILSFPQLAMSDIYILDGQHRILGVHLANEAISAEVDAARSRKSTSQRTGDKIAEREASKEIKKLEDQRERLASERINVQVHVVEDPVAYKQMFFDIADNALGITSSVKARFDSRKVVNRALEMVVNHPLLSGLVDPERDHIGRGSSFLMSARHVAEVVRSVNVGIDGRVSKRQEIELNERDIAEATRRFLDVLVESFTSMQDLLEKRITPEGLRATSLLGSVLLVRVLAGTYFELVHTDRAWEREKVVAFFKKLDKHMSGPAYEGSIWVEHTDVYDDGAFAPHGRRQDTKALTMKLVEWAIMQPDFLDQPPAPRPKTIDEIEAEEIAAEREALGI